MPTDPGVLKKKIALYRARVKAGKSLISSVSHEMRTPLAIAREALSLAKSAQGQGFKRQKVLIARAADGVERAGRIVEELLEVSRIESGRLKLKYSLVGVNEFLRGVTDSFRGLARQRKIRLSCRTPGDSVNIFIDPDRITEVLTNLLENALKFTRENGRIEVKGAVFESKVRVCVSDTGSGIERRRLGRLFTRAAKTSALQNRSGGLGLGLSIARELIERHGGEIWAESRPGAGSQFYFTLPRFYSTQMLDRHTRVRINRLLEQDVALHLVNLLIVNFHGFMRIAGTERGREVTRGLNGLIGQSLREFNRRSRRREFFVSEFRQGECTIVIPEAEEREVASLCNLFRNRINRYLRSFRIKDCFINVGVLEFLYRDSSLAARGRGAAIYVKKIFIGAEKRRCRRISYHMRLEPVLVNRSLGQTYSLDISRHGICFLSGAPVATDARLTVNLVLPHSKRPLPLAGRVAWIRQVQESGNRGRTLYKVGVEFLALSGGQRRQLNRFVDALARVRPCEPHNNP